MGLSLAYFYSLTPRVFTNILIGYANKQEKLSIESWEQTRRIMHSVLLPHKKEGTELKLTDVLLFKWEKEDDKVVKKPKTRAELEAYWHKRDNQKNKPKK